MPKETAKGLHLNIPQNLLLIKKEGKNILTPREREVLEVVKTGKTASKEIVPVLHITDQTIKNHFTSIYRKLEIPGKGKEDKKIRALIRAILLGEIEPFKPSIDQENTPIFKLGAFHQKKTPNTTL